MSEVTKEEMFLEISWRKDDGERDPENCRVENILKPILSHLNGDAKIGYHFGECDGHDEYHLEDLMSDLPKNAEWHTIYDSCYFPFTDGGSYSIIQVAYADNREHFYLSMSLGGCQLSSALTEYFKIPMTGKWAWSA